MQKVRHRHATSQKTRHIHLVTSHVSARARCPTMEDRRSYVGLFSLPEARATTREPASTYRPSFEDVRTGAFSLAAVS